MATSKKTTKPKVANSTKKETQEKEYFNFAIASKTDKDGIDVDLSINGKARERFVAMTFVSALLQAPEIAKFVSDALQIILEKQSIDFLEDEEKGTNKNGIKTISKKVTKN